MYEKVAEVQGTYTAPKTLRQQQYELEKAATDRPYS